MKICSVLNLTQKDAGAMCFPCIPSMKRAFDLFKCIGLTEKIIPYEMALKQNLNDFNGICLTNEAMNLREPDPFDTGVESITASASAMATEQFEPFMNALKNDPLKGWKMLMEYDRYSTRSYMTLVGTNNQQYSNQVRLNDSSCKILISILYFVA